MEATLAMVGLVAAVESLARKSCKVHFAFAFALKRKGGGEIEERQKREKNKDRLANNLGIHVAPLTEKKGERTHGMVRRISRIIESARGTCPP